MPICHLFEESLRFELLGAAFPLSSAQSVIGFFYSIVPGMFMFCMGATIIFSRHNSPENMIRRGLILILIFFILNIFRFTLPTVMSVTFTGNTEVFDANICEFMISDILSFAGLSFIALGLAKKYNVNTKILLAVSVILIAIQSVLPNIVFGTSILERIISGFIGWFVYTSPGYSYFPLMSWFIFPVFGMLYSELMTRSADERTFHFRAMIISAMVICVFFLTSLIGISDYQYIKWAYCEGFFLSIGSGTFAITMCFLIQSVAYIIFNRMPDGKFSRNITSVAREINGIYCTHWILLMWTVIIPMYLLDIRPDKMLYFVILGLLLFFVSYFFSKYGKSHIARRKRTRAGIDA